MKFFKLNSDKQINVNIFDYKIDFNKIEGSKPEIKVKTFLKPFWKTDTVLEEFRIPGSKLRIDILNINQKIVIEVSPSSTHSFNKFFHGHIVVFADRLKKEMSKEDWSLKHGYKYVELGDEELKNLTKEMFKEKFDIIL